MTFQDAIKDLKRLENAIKENNQRIQTVAINEVASRLRKRIFNRGLATDGRKIGNYSTRPLLTGSSNFRTKKAANRVFGSKAQRSKRRWVTVGGKRLIVLEGGYKEFRDLSGNQTSKVDLQYRGNLFRGVKIGTSGKNIVLGIKGTKNAKIAAAQEEHWGKDIFKPSKTEEKAADRKVIEEIDVILESIL